VGDHYLSERPHVLEVAERRRRVVEVEYAVDHVRPLAVGSRAHLTALTRAIAAHRLEPVIDRLFDFDEAPAAYRYFQDTRPFGKVVIAHT
jgi:NADPH:quinone reductase-like Zn-dependent oxidoreductase